MIDLRFDRVSKCYRVREEEASPDGAKNPLVRKLQNLRRGAKDFWAVRNVSFEVERGEALGIIGHNGAGKSTVLKMLSNITTPTSGEITINGRLAALIEVGSGFHPELSGRENVFLSGSILGMRSGEIAKKLDAIIDFAGVRQFIDTPVKRYSSGMYVRLGFSIAAHLNPDILLLDEVLAVGDAAFQSKCFERINSLRDQGKTIVFISHDLSAVERLCNRAILMEQGQIKAEGSPREVISRYMKGEGGSARAMDKLVFDNPMPNPHARFEVERVEALDRQGNVKNELRTGDYVRFRIVWRAQESVEHGSVELGFLTPDGLPLIQCSTRPLTTVDVRFESGRNKIELEFERFPLTSGEFKIMAGLAIPLHEWLYRNLSFGNLSVKKGDYFGSDFSLTSDISVVVVDHRWITRQDDDNCSLDEALYAEVASRITFI